MKKEITFKGKTFATQYYRDLTDEEYKSILDEYYAKPSWETLKKQLVQVSNGGLVTNEIYKMYFKDIASDVVFGGDKFSLNDVLSSRELVGFFIAKAEASPHIFNDNTLCKKFEHVVQLGGKGLARKATQFPMRTAMEVIGKYCTNGNYYDFSCGWGIRLLAALSKGVNYYGTDPNVRLVPRLRAMVDDYYKTDPLGIMKRSEVQIVNSGSENYVPEWENKMSLCFSSPPYFDLEDYVYGEQSIRLYPEYKSWLDNYVRPTMENCKRYLTNGGVFAYNIKNTPSYNLLDDFKAITKGTGFVFVGALDLKNGKRVYGHTGDEKGTTHYVDTNENVLVYKKQ